MKRIVNIDFSDKEMNYLETSLYYALKKDKESRIAKLGNVPHLIWFSNRLLIRMRKIHQDSYRKRMGEVKWKEHCKLVNQMLRKARRKD